MAPEARSKKKPAQEEPRPSRARWVFKRVLALLVCVLTVLVVAWILSAALERRIRDIVSQRLGVPVMTEASGVDVLSGRAWAEGITVPSPPGFEEPYAVSVRRVELSTSALSWITTSIRSSKIELWDADVRIEIRDGRTNFAVLADNVRESRRPDAVVRTFLFERCVFHNAAVTVADTGRARTSFTEVEAVIEDLVLRRGIARPARVEAKATVRGERSRSALDVEGTLGPTQGTLNLDLFLEVKRLDLRDFKPYFRSDPSRVVGGHRVNIHGRFVCDDNMLDGTRFVLASTAGGTYPIGIEGPIDSPRLTAGSAFVNTINVPIQKVFRFFRKLTFGLFD